MKKKITRLKSLTQCTVGCDKVTIRRGRLRRGVVVGFGGNVNVEEEANAIVVVEQEREE